MGDKAKAKVKAPKRSRRKRAVLPRVLMLQMAHVKAPFAAIQVQIAGGRIASYVLAGQVKAVR